MTVQVLDIIQYPDPRLREVATEVTEFDKELQEQVASIVLTCQVYRAQGLAATQVGINKRILVCATDGEPEIYINPVIVSSEGSQKMSEGCLSFPGIHAVLSRHEEIVVSYRDVDGSERVAHVDDVGAVALQHEIDHLNGVLFIDRVSPFKRRYMMKALKKTTKMPKMPANRNAKAAAARKERKRKNKHRKRA